MMQWKIIVLKSTVRVAAIINAGGRPLDIDLNLGNVTMQQTMDCFPFGNTLVKLEFTSRASKIFRKAYYSKQERENEVITVQQITVRTTPGQELRVVDQKTSKSFMYNFNNLRHKILKHKGLRRGVKRERVWI